MFPGSHQIDKPTASRLRIKSFHKFRILRGDPPVTLAALTRAAEMTPKSQKRGCCNITGVRSKGYCFYHIGSAADTAACYERNVISDSFITKPLIHCRQSELYRDSHIVAYSGRSGAGASAEAVDSDNVRAAACNSAGDGLDIMMRRGGDGVRAFRDHSGAGHVSYNFSSRKMPSDSRFCALSHFDLNAGAGV